MGQENKNEKKENENIVDEISKESKVIKEKLKSPEKKKDEKVKSAKMKSPSKSKKSDQGLDKNNVEEVEKSHVEESVSDNKTKEIDEPIIASKDEISPIPSSS